MKKLITIIVIALMCATSAFAQNSVTLTFTAQTTTGGYIQPDSITVENLPVTGRRPYTIPTRFTH